MMVNSGSVLSLKKIIFLNIISNLNSYRPNDLARLPPTLRQKLLMNVPVADMWWLENSRVSEGIDMEHVWTTILTTRMGKNILKREYKAVLYALPLPPREIYMEGLGYIILNEEILLEGYHNHIQNFLDLLFSVRHCMGIKNWKGFIKCNPGWQFKFVILNDTGAAIPAKKVLQYYKPVVTGVDLFQLLVDVGHYFPKQASILAANFVKSSLWKEQTYPVVLGRLRQCLSRVEALTFAAIIEKAQPHHSNADNLSQLYSSALYFIVTEMLAFQGCKSLREIHLQSSNSKILGFLLTKIAPLLSSNETNEHINHTPYKYLRELTLVSQENLSPNSSSLPEASLCNSISSVIKHQKNLETFLLGGINLACPIVHFTTLFEALAELIQRSNKKYITLATLPITFPIFRETIEKFLKAESASTQTLCFSEVTITKASLPPKTAVKADQITMGKEDYNFKTVKFCQMFLQPQVIFWFFDKNHHFHLHKLELDSISSHNNMSLLTAIARHSNLVVEHLALSNIRIQHCGVVSRDFQLLMKKDRLKILSITNCNIGSSGVLQDITTAVGSLYFWSGRCVQVLDLKENKLGAETDAHIRDFFVALFRLWNLQRMSLDISSNGFRPHHFYNIHNIWRMFSFGEKLRQLNCKGNGMEWKQRVLVGQLAQWVFV